MKNIDLPYFNERKANIDMIVLHCHAFNVQNGIEILHKVKLSAHYMIDLDGKIYRTVANENRAWHTKTGVSYWKGVEDINSHSIGIEVSSLTLGQEKYSRKQIYSLLKLCKTLIKKYRIKKKNIVGHSDICPNRKPDPGKSFPWEYLARHGVGIWYNINDARKVCEDDESKMLSEIGYNVTDIIAAKWAFCKRFLPYIIPIDEVANLINQPIPDRAEELIENSNFRDVLKAVYYKYCKLVSE